MLDCSAEPKHDIVGIGDEVEEEAVELGAVDVVVRRIVIVLYAVQLGVAHHFACVVWAGDEVG